MLEVEAVVLVPGVEYAGKTEEDVVVLVEELEVVVEVEVVLP